MSIKAVSENSFTSYASSKNIQHAQVMKSLSTSTDISKTTSLVKSSLKTMRSLISQWSGYSNFKSAVTDFTSHRWKEGAVNILKGSAKAAVIAGTIYATIAAANARIPHPPSTVLMANQQAPATKEMCEQFFAKGFKGEFCNESTPAACLHWENVNVPGLDSSKYFLEALKSYPKQCTAVLNKEGEKVIQSIIEPGKRIFSSEGQQQIKKKICEQYFAKGFTGKFCSKDYPFYSGACKEWTEVNVPGLDSSKYFLDLESSHHKGCLAILNEEGQKSIQSIIKEPWEVISDLNENKFPWGCLWRRIQPDWK
jgi:hypothetical protein